MLKSVLKEVFIILLLSIAILLILGILFYDYIPMNRVIPEREAYSTPNEIKDEINETITEAEKVEVTYEVTDSDLNIYKQSGRYVEGKANPFTLEESTPTETTDGNNDNGNNSDTNDNNNEETNVDKNSTGTFFNDEGIK